MIAIKKGKEPEELAELRREAVEAGLSPAEAYEILQNPLKGKIRDSLVKEQGHLCAYCMCRIPVSNVSTGVAPIVIEHFIPRNPIDHQDVGQGLDYNNLLAVCHGNRAARGQRIYRDLTCDAHRKDKEFRKIDPCVFVNPKLGQMSIEF